MTSVLHRLSRAAAGLHVRRVAAFAQPFKLRILPHSGAEGIQLDGRGGAFLIIRVEHAELQIRQRVKIVQQLRQTGVFQIQQSSKIV